MSRRHDPQDYALSQIRRMVDKVSATGASRLPPERQFAQEIGTGRRAIRRALDILEAEGLVWRNQGQGTFAGSRPVKSLDGAHFLTNHTSPIDIMEARLEIEPGLARLAATRASNAEIIQLEQLARNTAAAFDSPQWESADGAFHRAIAQAARNGFLQSVLDVINQIRRDATWRRLRDRARYGEPQPIYIEQHQRIVAAIAARDAYAAERAMHEHLEYVRDALMKIMTSPSGVQRDVTAETNERRTVKDDLTRGK